MTLAEIDAEIAEFTAARTAILVRGQSYTIDGRSLSRGDLEYIDGRIRSLRVQRDSITRGGGRRIRYGTPE